MDAHPVSETTDRNMLFNNHILGLRSHPWTRDAWLILMAENKLGHESGNCKELLDRFRVRVAAYNQPKSAKSLKPTKGQFSEDHLAYKRDADKNPGFYTDDKFKAISLEKMRRALAHNIIFFLDGCICKNPHLVKYKNDLELFIAYKQELEDQLKRAKEFPLSINARDTKRNRYTWSAKTNNDGEKQDGYNDDLVVILAFACYLWPEAMQYHGSLPGFPYDQIGWNDNSVYSDND